MSILVPTQAEFDALVALVDGKASTLDLDALEALTEEALVAIRARLTALEAIVIVPVDCELSPWVLETAQAWEPCQPDGTQTRDETWARTIVTFPANGGAPCGPLTEDRTGSQTCVFVPDPIDCELSAWSSWSAWSAWVSNGDGTESRFRQRTRTIVVAPANGGLACGPLVEDEIETQPIVVIPPTPGNHGYFDMLVARGDFWKGMSFRPVAGQPITSVHYASQLLTPANGGYANSNSSALAVTFSPGTDTDPHAQDAAKVAIPAFTGPVGTLTAPMTAAASGTVENITLSAVVSLDNDSHVLIGVEVLTVDRPSGQPPSSTLTVVRGQKGTTAVAHASGSDVKRSNNNLTNQVRFPLNTSDGNVYLFTWDGYWTDSYMGLAAFPAHKAFQFSSVDDALWLEPQMRFDGGRNVTTPPGGIARAADWNPALHVAGPEMRSYNVVGGPADWAASGGNKLGPVATFAEPINPKSGAFAIFPNAWTRWWVRIDQRANDYDLMDFWVADETRDAVQIYTQIPLSVKLGSGVTANRINKWWVEFNTSATEHVRGDLGDLVAYVRNFGVLLNPGNVSSLLVKPGVS